jgi:hypothetical protein
VALTLTINGVDKTALLKDGSLDIDKTGATERVTLDVLVKNDNTASAYRPQHGDTVILMHNDNLLGGGPIVRVEDQRLGGDSGTVTRITVRDWMYLAEQVIIEDRYFPPQDSFALFDQLVATYLADKGVTNLNPSTGGPQIPELWVKNETLLSVFLQIQDQTGYPYRINADKECALVVPGSLPGPVTLDTSNILEGLTWTQDELFEANRLFLTSGVPDSGPGPITFTETHIADGLKKTYPVNVIPNRSLIGRIANPGGYVATDTVLDLKELTPGMVIVEDNRLTVPGDETDYVVQADATVADDGTVTVTIAPGLDDDVTRTRPSRSATRRASSLNSRARRPTSSSRLRGSGTAYSRPSRRPARHPPPIPTSRSSLA